MPCPDWNKGRFTTAKYPISRGASCSTIRTSMRMISIRHWRTNWGTTWDYSMYFPRKAATRLTIAMTRKTMTAQRTPNGSALSKASQRIQRYYANVRTIHEHHGLRLFFFRPFHPRAMRPCAPRFGEQSAHPRSKEYHSHERLRRNRPAGHPHHALRALPPLFSPELVTVQQVLPQHVGSRRNGRKGIQIGLSHPDGKNRVLLSQPLCS